MRDDYIYEFSFTCHGTDKPCSGTAYRCPSCNNVITYCQCGCSYSYLCTCAPLCVICDDPIEDYVERYGMDPEDEKGKNDLVGHCGSRECKEEFEVEYPDKE